MPRDMSFEAFVEFVAGTDLRDGDLHLRLQSRLERFFIGRYVSRNPGSGWHVTTGRH